MNPEFPNRRKLDHAVPFWVKSNELHECFFITINTSEREKNFLAKDEIWAQLEDSVINRNSRGIWDCRLFLAMPDHIHALIVFDGSKGMEAAIKDWKRWQAREAKIQWQDRFFDHRLRSADSAIQKREYILANPVRAGLCQSPQDWPYVFPGQKG